MDTVLSKSCRKLLCFYFSTQGLNAAPFLRSAPHPFGGVAQEELRGSGGFEQQWPVGMWVCLL